jgi:hypothetical protein
MEKEILHIKKGALGPIRNLPESGLEIYPFTLFIGKQGTGKSLVSQLIYFFRNLPLLVRYYRARMGPEASPERIVRAALDNLRSARRAIAVFADPSAIVTYGYAGQEWGFRMDRRNRLIYPHQSMKRDIERMHGRLETGRLGKAVYIPAERILYSHAQAPSVWEILSWPSTLFRFGDLMEMVAETFHQWEDGQPDTVEGQRIREIGKQALGGEAYRVGERWKWEFGGKERLDIDMASSGQKANWPLVLLAEALFTWRRDREIPEDFAIHMEEPEIHLHPEAQVAMVKILAYLVNHGFRVLVTTHSMTVLYVLNNLIEASALPEDYTEPGIPEPEVRLKPGKVGAYFFREDGVVVDLVDKALGVISEAELAEVGESLVVEANRIDYLRAYGR